MPPGRSSKRRLKNKAVQSLRAKRDAPAASNSLGLDLLSDELREQMESTHGANTDMLILPGSKDSGKRGTEVVEEAPALSKAEQRKLRQVAMKKERRDNLGKVLESLEASKMSDEGLALLRPVHQRGVKETKRQRLRRDLRMQRAGLPLGSDSRLMQAKRGSLKDDDDDDDADDSDDDVSDVEAAAADDEGEEGRKPAGAKLSGGVHGVPVKRGSLDDDDDDDDGDDKGDEAEKKKRKLSNPGFTNAADEKEHRRQMMALAREESRKVKEAAGIRDVDEDQEAALHAAQSSAAAIAATGTAGHKCPRLRTIVRPEAIAEARLGLPITGMEQEIMEAVAAHDVVVLCGETGCGKTTQVPQFLLEAGYGWSKFPERCGSIGVTQPRRVAAVSTAARVADELGEELGQIVGYQVRYDRVVGAGTSLKFMTDGILLREVQEDFLLKRYSAIIIDEAHERSLNTDLLIGMLSRVVPLRRRLWREQQTAGDMDPSSPDAVHPLKLIIMSATLRTSDFTDNAKLFPSPPPVISVPARQFPVTVHFSRRTELQDYAGAAVKKVARIHRELPPGGILVFLTGQREVEFVCAKLRKMFAPPCTASDSKAPGGSTEGAAGKAGSSCPTEGEDDRLGFDDQFGVDRAESSGLQDDASPWNGEEEADDYEEPGSSDEDEEEVQILGGENMSAEDIAAAEKKFEEKLASASGRAAGFSIGLNGSTDDAGAPKGPPPLHVLPLYAMLPQQEQQRVFKATPAGHRLIVVATNVAETSLTIPGIRYVVDAGRSKQRLLEWEGSLATFEVRWISQASAMQRAGRAGRTGPGHCYRLFSSALFNDTFPVHTPPEIANTALEGVVLALKNLGVDKVQNFPFPSPPEPSALRSAESCLISLCALEPPVLGKASTTGASSPSSGANPGSLTPLGRAMASFPISPRHSRMILEVVAWQQQQQQAEKQGGSSSGGSTSGRSKAQQPSVGRANQALPYALAMAAALSVESPFVQVDSVRMKKDRSDKDKSGGSDSDGSGGGAESDEGGAGRQVSGAERARAEAVRQEANKTAQRAGAAHARFRSNDSDALGALCALCAFEAAGETDEFCRDNFMHARNLREAADLHRQLVRTLGSVKIKAEKGKGQASSQALEDGMTVAKLAVTACQDSGKLLGAVIKEPIPGQRVQDALRRALVAGWADQVSRRVRSTEYVERMLQDPSRKHHAVRYQACGIDEVVFLHPRSSLHKASPDFVVYTQLVRTTKRPYMAVITAVDAAWLTQCGTPLASLSAPLLDPVPVYRLASDAVLAWHDVSYGRQGWALPKCLRTHGDATVRASFFAAALLEGGVVKQSTAAAAAAAAEGGRGPKKGGKGGSAFAELRPLLLAVPATAAKPEMRCVARVGELIGALQRRGVDSRASLAAAWARDRSFLLREVGLWTTPSCQSKLIALWPRLVAEVIGAQ